MNTVKLPRKSVVREPIWIDAVIERENEDGYVLSGGVCAQAAASCLLRPAVGDRVLMVQSASAECFIVHVLTRTAGAPAQLGVPGAGELCIAHADLTLAAGARLSLISRQDVDICAAAGTLNLSARNVFTQALEGVVHNARHWVAQVHHCAFQVRDLLRVHSRHGMMTADQEMRIDAERISIG